MRFLKIAIQSDGIVYRIGNDYFSNSPFLFFASEIGRHFKCVYFVIPVKNIKEKLLNKDRILLKSNEIIIPLKPYIKVEEYYKKLPIFFIINIQKMFDPIKKSDVVFLRIPSLNSILAFFISVLLKKKIVTYIVGDEIKVIQEGKKYKGIKKKIALLLAKCHFFIYKLMVKKASVSFFLGMELLEKFGKIGKNHYIFFTSLVKEDEIVYRNDVCKDKEIKLIYIGRLSHEKGIDYLLEAYKMLYFSKKNISLSIVGEGDYFYKVKQFIINNNFEKIYLLGYLSKKEINKILLQHDIFILPSLSEGIPKVLLEAMGKGLPIIATNVGGIPDIIKHMENGILIPPKSSEAIVNAIKLLINNVNLRKKIIKNGYKFVKEYTAEKQAKKIVEIIYRHLNND